MSGDRATKEPLNRHATSIDLYRRKQRAVEGPKTAIIIGVARGGTSMVAGATRGLGFFMGKVTDNNNEDLDFSYKSLEHMKNTIKSRNSNYRKWGWKFPAAASYLDDLMPQIANPYLIIVCRDLAATANGHVRWHRREASFAISDIMLHMQRNVSLAFRWRIPTLMVSYEKASLRPEKFLDELSLFLEEPVEVDIKTLVQYLEPGSYKKYEEVVASSPEAGEPPSSEKNS